MLTWVLYLLISLGKTDTDSTGRVAIKTLFIGILLGLSIGTKPTLFLLLPLSILFLVKTRGENDRGLIRTYAFAMISILVVLLLITSHSIRSGHIELSRSKGVHLWQSVVLDSNWFLNDTEEYALLTTHLSPKELSQLSYWNLRNDLKKSSDPRLRILFEDKREFDEFLFSMIVKGVISHPIGFIGIGVERTYENMCLGLRRTGLHQSKNPIIPGRKRLKPLFPKWKPDVNVQITLIQAYVPAISLTYLLLLMSSILKFTSRSTFLTSKIRDLPMVDGVRAKIDERSPLIIYLALSFGSIFYLTLQLTYQSSRIPLMLLPFSMLLLSVLLDCWLKALWSKKHDLPKAGVQ